MSVPMDIDALFTTLEEVIVVLKDASGALSLPIWVARHDGASIVAGMEDIWLPRPLTHDLIKNLLQVLEVCVERVEICDLRENVYYAAIQLRKGNELISMDARPSDAIAIAVRTGAPIFVNEEVLAQSPAADLSGFEEKDRGRWADILEEIDADYRKYKS